jgi:hypothetical protein
VHLPVSVVPWHEGFVEPGAGLAGRAATGLRSAARAPALAIFAKRVNLPANVRRLLARTIQALAFKALNLGFQMIAQLLFGARAFDAVRAVIIALLSLFPVYDGNALALRAVFGVPAEHGATGAITLVERRAGFVFGGASHEESVTGFCDAGLGAGRLRVLVGQNTALEYLRVELGIFAFDERLELDLPEVGRAVRWQRAGTVLDAAPVARVALRAEQAIQRYRMSRRAAGTARAALPSRAAPPSSTARYSRAILSSGAAASSGANFSRIRLTAHRGLVARVTEAATRHRSDHHPTEDQPSRRHP